MANKNLFRSLVGSMNPPADTINEAGGSAYAFDPRHALAQYAATGCLNTTFYANAETQLSTVLQICGQVEPEFVAKTALFARTEGHMKDLPALLVAVLSARDGALAERVFDRVIDNGKMLRNYVQIVRSGVTGRKSLGTRPKRMVRAWFDRRSDEQVFVGSIGSAPSMADVIRMVHPRPTSESRRALLGHLIGRPVAQDQLPEKVREYEAFKRAPSTSAVPDVPFEMLTSLELGSREWKEIAKRASWQMTRMNLNTFLRHGVFADRGVTKIVADRLRNEWLIKKARVFPYQLMMAWKSASNELPVSVRDALQDAMEIAIDNVPEVPGKVFVFPDVSGSMHSPVTGHRKGATTAVRCIDVAALVAAAMLRKNRGATIVPFSDSVVEATLNSRDSVMTNAEKLASLPSGGTNCSAPMAMLNKRKLDADLVVYVSDNESWMDSTAARSWAMSSVTATMAEWSKLKSRCPKAKLVCIDIQPYGSTQAKESDDVFNVGGFSDQVFRFIADVAAGRAQKGYWVNTIEKMSI